MKAISKGIAFFILAFLFLQCNKEEGPQDICFGFDRRQCDTDPWASGIPLTDTKAQKEEKMEAYLVNLGINTISVVLEDRSSITCRGCHNCPEGDYYIIRMKEDGIPKVIEMDPLNVAYLECPD